MGNPFPPGSRLGAFTLGELVGQGGIAAVYRGTEDATGTTVAIKVLLSQLGGDPDVRARFAREAQVARAVVHENVAGVRGFGEQFGVSWIAFDFIQGGTLADRLSRDGRL